MLATKRHRVHKIHLVLVGLVGPRMRQPIPEIVTVVNLGKNGTKKTKMRIFIALGSRETLFLFQ